ncbi:MAG: hypothetical protein DRJ65_09075 [Acidobacteria bacterium]|nr:MAG: hypothetical protein DRJ65_09075 [Acidobacteriota bacterium]
MKFVETSVFSKQVVKMLSDVSYRMLQSVLMFRPTAGAVVRGSGGLRKVRWQLPGSGRRGGLRVLYFWDPPETIYMVFMYKKTDQDDLTPEQLKVLKNLVKERLS